MRRAWRAPALLLALAGPVPGSGAAAPCGLDDGTALVQRGLDAGLQALQRAGTLARINLTGLPAGVHCEDVPEACMPPFNCNHHTALTMYSSITQSTHGHPNYNSWCHTPYLDYGLHCQKSNFREATKALARSRQKNTELTEMDGQYCFAAGHCDNVRVSAKTTVEQAEEMCDEMFGHDVWTRKGLLDLFKAKAGHKRQDNEYAQLACAMGNFHCDVLYCKDKFCDEEHWKAKYGHLARPDFAHPRVISLQEISGF